MKNLKKYIGLSLVAGSLLWGGLISLSQITTNLSSLKAVVYTEVNTNWDFVTNTTSATWQWNSNGPAGVNTMYFTDDHPSAYVGVITSNNFLNVYYNGKLISNKLLETKTIGKIEITWEQKTLYYTNIVNYP